MIPAALALLLALAPGEAAERSRWVVAVGTHQGGPGQDKLRHAGSDALAFAEVMLDLGSVQGDQLLLLNDADVSTLRTQIGTLGTRIAASRDEGALPELIFYYSGHSDDRGLTPWGELLPWAELRDLLTGIDADVRLTILDSCASGAFVRPKGGIPTAALLRDTTHVVHGDATITSASADEAAQESDRLGGSYFTHHLVAGLRGAADTDEDRQVTLEEAYDYASRETLRGTESTWTGSQHATYDIDLVGRGDVVLTDLRNRDAVLQLDAALDGVLSVRSPEGELVAELYKPDGVAVSYAVPTGHYTVRLRARGSTFKAKINVSSAGPVSLDADDFTPVGSLEVVRVRGTVPVSWTRTHHAGAHLLPLIGTYGVARDIRLVGVAANLLGAVHPELRGWQLGTWSHVNGDLYGVDMELGLSSIRGDLHGVQASPLNVSGRVHGLQLGGLNHAGGDVRGMQIGALNWATGTLRGVQLLGLANIVQGRSTEGQAGMQIGLAYNHAASGFRGLQLAPINDAARLRGLQIGVINMASELQGLQLGVVNVAEELDGEVLGLVNIVRDGYHAVELYLDEYGPVNLAVKSGGKHLYSKARVGFDFAGQPVGTHLGLGLGSHVAWSRLSFDADLSVILPERVLQRHAGPGLDLKLDVAPGVVLTRNVAVFFGGSFGAAVSFDGSDPHPEPDEHGRAPGLWVPSYAVAGLDGATNRVWGGFLVGLRVAF